MVLPPMPVVRALHEKVTLVGVIAPCVRVTVPVGKLRAVQV